MQKHYVIIADRQYTNGDGGDTTYVQAYAGTNKEKAEVYVNLYNQTPFDRDTKYHISTFYKEDGKTLAESMLLQCTSGKKPKKAKYFYIR